MDAVEQLRKLEPGYQANEEVRKQQQEITLGCLIGPLAVGKTAIANDIVRRNPEFGKVHGFTTRGKRDGETENAYRFLAGFNPDAAQKATAMEQILEKTKRGELVQFTVSRDGNVYGSEIDDYPASYSVLPCFAHAVEDLRQRPFRRVVSVGIALPLDQYKQRLYNRLLVSDSAIDSRLKEAESSYQWLLNDSQVRWVNNSDGSLGAATDHTIDIIKGNGDSSEQAHRHAGQILEWLVEVNKQLDDGVDLKTLL